MQIFKAFTFTLAVWSATSGWAADTIKIGVLTDMAGTYADTSGEGSVLAAKMAVEDFGAKVLNKKVEVISADHQNKADVGSALANKWFDVDGVNIIVDLPNSAVALAVQAIAKEKNKINVVSSGGSAELTNKACSPNGFHWAWDSYAMANSTARALAKEGGDTWFFLVADYVFGHTLLKDATAAVVANGGKVLGDVKHPQGATEFSSFILQAISSKAKVIGLANAGAETITAIKQSAEFGLAKNNQKLAAFIAFISDVHSLGLKTAQGLIFTDGFYWDLNDDTRAFANRFAKRFKGKMPGMGHAGVYSSVLHYLKAVKAAGSDDTKKVLDKMRELPVNDILAKGGVVRKDGRMVHDMYLVQVKSPAESKKPWDYYKILATIPGKDAFRPLEKSECPLVK